jgi:hypothetical protein
VLKIEELTEAMAIRKFTIPLLSQLPGVHRLKVMRTLAPRWSHYSTDNELMEQLKTVKFIPLWDSSDTGNGNMNDSTVDCDDYSMNDELETLDDADTPPLVREVSVEELTRSEKLRSQENAYLNNDDGRNDDATLRAPGDLYSWKNKDLLEMLRGEHQARYFAPPWLRSTDIHKMMMDLGMQVCVPFTNLNFYLCAFLVADTVRLTLSPPLPSLPSPLSSLPSFTLPGGDPQGKVCRDG